MNAILNPNPEEKNYPATVVKSKMKHQPGQLIARLSLFRESQFIFT
jgi:hypothetical protein